MKKNGFAYGFWKAFKNGWTMDVKKCPREYWKIFKVLVVIGCILIWIVLCFMNPWFLLFTFLFPPVLFRKKDTQRRIGFRKED